MPTVMSDNRKYIAMTAEDADKLMAEIAQIEIEDAADKAYAECRIARIKADRDAAKTAADARIKRLANDLNGYIDAHREDFVKPRARATDWGRYGLRTVTSVMYRDTDELLQRLTLADRKDLLKITTKLDTEAIDRALTSGEEIEGVSKTTGERAFYKTNKTLLDRAAEKAATVVKILEG